MMPLMIIMFSLRLMITSDANTLGQVPYINFLMKRSSTVISDDFLSSSFKLPVIMEANEQINSLY